MEVVGVVDGRDSVIDAPRVVDEALAAGRLVAFGGRLVCQGCGWSGPVAAVGLAAAHVEACESRR